FSVHKWAFICTRSAQFYTITVHCLLHILFGNSTTTTFSRAPIHFSSCFGSAHHTTSSMNRTIKSVTAFFRVNSLYNNRNISSEEHTSEHQSRFEPVCRLPHVIPTHA